MERYITIALGVFLGVLILGSLGTFFMYVPILPFAAVVTVLLGMILMFVLGIQVGRPSTKLNDSSTH